MKIKIERCSGLVISATVLTGIHKGARVVVPADLDYESRQSVVSTFRDYFVNHYGCNRNSIKSEWWN